MASVRVPIFTEDAGWHGEQLKQAFSKRGIESFFVSLRDCGLSISNNHTADTLSTSISIPSYKNVLPSGAFVRGVAGGTLQQVMMRLNILHMLQQSGVVIYNQAKSIERTVDKAMTSFLLHQHGASTAATWVCESRAGAEIIRQHAKKNQQTLVLKPLFGSQGQGVRKLLPDESLPVPMQQHVDGVYYFQQFIATKDAPHDYRIFVINGKVIAAMKRTGASWVNNIAAGGQCEAIIADHEMSILALKAAAAVEIDYCGVDIIQAVTGEYYVLEVNSIPAWKGLQSVTDVNIAQLLVDDFLSKLNN